MKKMLIVSTTPVCFATFAKGQAKFLSQYYRVELISSSSSQNKSIEEHEGVKLNVVEMSRQISPLQDFRSLWQLFVFFRKHKPDVVYSFTPKAGLLSMTASFFAGVQLRMHNIIGMPLMETKGIKHFILKKIEAITYLFSNKLLCNSHGLKEYINSNLLKKPITVIAGGSINGVDMQYFKDTFSSQDKNKIKEELSIDKNDFVLTYVGRVVKDKGIDELIEAFIGLQVQQKSLKLLIVGEVEKHFNPINKSSLEHLKCNAKIIFRPFANDIRPYLAVSNVLVLPSYREGLPNILLEAGSFGLPLIASDINGCNEVVRHRENGLLVEKKNIKALRGSIKQLVENEALYQQFKRNARKMIQDRFEQNLFYQALLREFRH
jgi:glycosyltransferase involved in cell wall biosynthesis